MADSYYGFSISTSGAASATTYYYVTISNASGLYDGAGVTLYPTGAQATFFSYRSNSVQWQSPPARVSAGATVVTSGSSITGVLGVSPAINVSLTLVCNGSSGPIGSVTLSPGQTEVPFNFHVTPSESIGSGNDFLEKNAARPESE
jgi:hypothetical protein